MNKSIDAHECFNRSNPSEVKSFPAIEINKREIGRGPKIIMPQIIIENEKRKDHKLLEKEKEEMFVDL